MKRGCGKFWSGLVALAHEESNEEATAHVAACSSCAATLVELKFGLASLRSGYFDAPQNAIDLAKAVFPRPTPVRARLVSSTLSGAGARGGEAFQAVYDFVDGQARVLYEPDGGKWRVMGSVSVDGYECDHSTEDPTRFEFVAAKLEDAEVRLFGVGREIILPAPDLKLP